MSEERLQCPLGGSRVRPNLKEEAATYLRDQILAGHLRPGDRIDQDRVAAELGISRLPVREALITLSGEGMIEMRPRRGAFVAQLTPDDLLDQYVIFGSLCGLAAARAARALTEAQFAELDGLLARMDTAEEPEELERLNFRFHQIINKAGSSKLLARAIGTIAKGMPTHFYEFAEDWRERARSEHKGIVKALRSGDADRAEVAVRAHLRSGGEQALTMLQSNGFWDRLAGASEEDE
ncbi:MAG TPA: GntR family transcriptional regulator [Streptosporangiaceae bacterium]|nr:GntR family transcriptional regulator [Streptosporangiaceae bacterium]